MPNAPYINSSANIINQTTGSQGNSSKILKNAAVLIDTSKGNSIGGGANGVNGGSGAVAVIPGLATCNAGAGGTSSSQNGKNAQDTAAAEVAAIRFQMEAMEAADMAE